MIPLSPPRPAPCSCPHLPTTGGLDRLVHEPDARPASPSSAGAAMECAGCHRRWRCLVYENHGNQAPWWVPGRRPGRLTVWWRTRHRRANARRAARAESQRHQPRRGER